jgi:hypothetical protein
MPPTGCWLWTGSTVHGYGRVTWRGKTRQVHRLVYELAVGPLIPGLVLDHLCGQRHCANPAHLEQVTIATNCQRGRRAKLNQAAADEIRAAVARGEKRTDPAKRYGVSRAAIGHVITGRTWPLTHQPHMEPPTEADVPLPPRAQPQ